MQLRSVIVAVPEQGQHGAPPPDSATGVGRSATVPSVPCCIGPGSHDTAPSSCFRLSAPGPIDDRHLTGPGHPLRRGHSMGRARPMGRGHPMSRGHPTSCGHPLCRGGPRPHNGRHPMSCCHPLGRRAPRPCDGPRPPFWPRPPHARGVCPPPPTGVGRSAPACLPFPCCLGPEAPDTPLFLRLRPPARAARTRPHR